MQGAARQAFRSFAETPARLKKSEGRFSEAGLLSLQRPAARCLTIAIIIQPCTHRK